MGIQNYKMLPFRRALDCCDEVESASDRQGQVIHPEIVLFKKKVHLPGKCDRLSLIGTSLTVLIIADVRRLA